jgi:hypothetical protein
VTKLDQILAAQADEIEAIVASFERNLDEVLRLAAQDVKKQLRKRLEIQKGIVTGSAGNQAVLETVDELLERAMAVRGYEGVLDRYIESFNGQFVSFDQVLKHINSELQWPLPTPNFDGPVKAELDSLKKTQRTLIDDTVGKAVLAAKGAALTSVGALTPEQLAQSISEQLGKSIAQAESLADTGISTFYRAINDKGFRIIEADLPRFKIRYTYEGPLDKLNRPFCRKLQEKANAGKSWTRKQIDAMKNGQIPNVWLTAGGYRCRHQWIVDTKDLNQQQEGKPAPNPKRVEAGRAIREKRGQVKIDRKPGRAAQAREQARKKVKERRAK